MKSILVVNQCFYPDVDATGQIITDLTEDFVKIGIRTTVITGRNQKTYRKKEIYNGVTVIRVNVLRLNKKVLLYRYLNYLSLFPAVFMEVLFLPKYDYVFMVSSPPFMFLIGWLLKTIKKSKLIFNLQDLYPDVAINLRLIKNPFLAQIIKNIVLRFYRCADKIVCVGEKMGELLLERGVPSEKIVTIHNWADSELLYPINNSGNYFISQKGLQDKFVIQYSGNFGMVHEINTILFSAKVLADHRDIYFVFVGDGVQAKNIKQFVLFHKLCNITMFSFQSRNNLNFSLNACDVAVVSIKEGFQGNIVPSKIYGVLAVGKPIISICHPDSELANIVLENECGVIIQPGDIDGCVKQILKLYNNNEWRRSMGNNAHQAFLKKYDRTLQTKKYIDVITKL